jgi:chromosome segregation ATPase
MSDEQELTPERRIEILSEEAVKYRNECERLRNEINAMRRQVEQWSQAARDTQADAQKKLEGMLAAAEESFDERLEAERKRAAATLQKTKKAMAAQVERLREVYGEAVDRIGELESRGPSEADIEAMRETYNKAMADGLRQLVRRAVVAAAKQDAAKVIAMLTEDIASQEPFC